MATAPTARQAARKLRPGDSTPGQDDTHVVITIKGRTLTLYMRHLGPGDDSISRAQCNGVAVSGIVMNVATGKYQMGLDTLLILWWMARRKAGEVNLTWPELCAEFPDYSDLASAKFEFKLDQQFAGGNGGPEALPPA